MKLQVTSLWQHLSWGGVSFTASIRQEKTWGANNSVYGTYAELLEFNDCYKGIVLFCNVINKYWVFWFFLSLSPSSVVCGMNIGIWKGMFRASFKWS